MSPDYRVAPSADTPDEDAADAPWSDEPERRETTVAAALHGARALDRGDIARDLGRERRLRIHARGIEVERQHAVGERPSLAGGAGAAERAA